MELLPGHPNVELRAGPEGQDIVVLAFPYDPHIVAVVRGIPNRRFDWETREWWWRPRRSGAASFPDETGALAHLAPVRPHPLVVWGIALPRLGPGGASPPRRPKRC